MLQYMQAHPLISALLGAMAALALIGLWYVVSHHARTVIMSLICIAGTASGMVVVWRGVGSDHMDLIGIGVFLLVIFPIFLLQTLRGGKSSPPRPTMLPHSHKA
jgi:hypothetical protein